MPSIAIDGLSFHYLDEGKGIPFIFQHGLGGSVEQPAGLFEPQTGIRFLSFDCRAHGRTHPVGDPARIGLASFADDLLGFMDQLQIRSAIVGGISMGAAVALKFALMDPSRVLGLILSRPAWLDSPMERNARVYSLIAHLIRQHGAMEGMELFKMSPAYLETLALSPDAAASLLGQFEGPNAEAFVARLERIPLDAPCDDLRALERIATPTLILANRQDPIHPFEYGEVLAARIPGAELRELTPKSVSRDRHSSDVKRCLADFLESRFLSARPKIQKRNPVC